MTTFDPGLAATYATFVDVAYAMFYADEANPHPAPIPILGYEFVSYVTMRDPSPASATGEPAFYGFIAARDDGTEYVLALRGTDDAAEFFSDLRIAAHPFPVVPNSGHVVAGFSDIYLTMQVDALDASLTFGAQVAHAIAKHRSGGVRGPRALPIALPPKLVIAGHSLGAALATLLVMESAYRNETLAPDAPPYLETPGAYTFGSPNVGNDEFAALYARYANDEGIQTWRIVNTADFVPLLPPKTLGWVPVGTACTYDSHDSVFTLSHAHALSTYEALLRASV